jgi:hypothetical protein
VSGHQYQASARGNLATLVVEEERSGQGFSPFSSCFGIESILK